MFKLGQLVEYYLRNVFIEKLCTKCVQQPSSRPLFKIGKLPKSANPIGTIFCKYDIQKGDCPKSLKNVIVFHLEPSFVLFLLLRKQKGPRTSANSLFRLQKIFKIILHAKIYHLANFYLLTRRGF